MCGPLVFCVSSDTGLDWMLEAISSAFVICWIVFRVRFFFRGRFRFRRHFFFTFVFAAVVVVIVVVVAVAVAAVVNCSFCLGCCLLASDLWCDLCGKQAQL